MLRAACIRFHPYPILAIIAAVLAFASPALPQSSEKAPADDPERRHAFELYESGKMVEAMPLLEKLAADHPADVVVVERWGYSVLGYASTLSDPDSRKKARARGRQIALKAKALGDNSPILQIMLEVPEDGSEVVFSERKEVDEAMKAAEADFARGDLDKAREGYLRALLLDPNNYEATLFIGDVYFRQGVYGSAGEWFSHAIQINPNLETAYRYWGDTLTAANKSNDAREKFIAAVVAEPYNPRSWQGLNQWAQRHKVQINYVRLKDGSSVTVKDDKHINITLDSSLGKDDPNALAWTTYGIGRAGWHTEQSEKEFPNVPRNRRTLQEEAHALGLMITVLKEQRDHEKKLKGLDPSLQSLIKIQEAGFLEPFVLLNRADNEIAQDYEPYRTTNREDVRRYLDEFVVPKTPDNN